MKNGRALYGHRRIVTGVGEPTHLRGPWTGGYTVGCLCGWQGGHHCTREAAQAAHKTHLDFQIDECLFRCKRCGIEKPVSQMRPDHRYICLVCFSRLGDEWQQRNPRRAARAKWNHHLLTRFGISLEEAETLLASQGGVCAICGQEINDPRGYGPHIDHDHITGQVRGVLCLQCNSGLGHFRDDPERLQAAIAYLARVRG
jgi:hypothetical protein